MTRLDTYVGPIGFQKISVDLLLPLTRWSHFFMNAPGWYPCEHFHPTGTVKSTPENRRQ